MEGIQNSDVATLSLLGGGAYGYGLGNRGYGAGFEFDGSVVNAKVEANKEAATAGHNCLSQQISEEADRTARLDQTLGVVLRAKKAF